jgi:hypothetical protein
MILLPVRWVQWADRGLLTWLLRVAALRRSYGIVTP